MAKLKVGVLIPYSGIYKNLKTDFLNGIDAAIPEFIKSNIIYLPEFINVGSTKQVEEAFRKLVLFESVDILIGIVESNVLENIVPIINNEKTPLIISNLGAYIPTEQLSSPYLFYNSMHLWKSEWAMGKWMQANYGGIPAIGSMVYDAGYNINECFRIGTVAAGAEECRVHVLKLEGLKGFADTQPLVDVFAYEMPSHAHIVLSGIEGNQFINNFYANPVSDILPISVNPFMVEDGMQLNINPSLEILNASTWDYNNDKEENIKFKDIYREDFDDTPNAFSLLGYETGLAVVKALDSLRGVKPTRAGITDALTHIDVNGPRGKLILSTVNMKSPQHVYIRKAKIDNTTNEIRNEIVDKVEAIEWNASSLLSTRIDGSTWQNPYLCV
jgi:branched-chain amino acid transport system substrate-binding protein